MANIGSLHAARISGGFLVLLVMFGGGYEAYERRESVPVADLTLNGGRGGTVIIGPHKYESTSVHDGADSVNSAGNSWRFKDEDGRIISMQQGVIAESSALSAAWGHLRRDPISAAVEDGLTPGPRVSIPSAPGASFGRHFCKDARGSDSSGATICRWWESELVFGQYIVRVRLWANGPEHRVLFSEFVDVLEFVGTHIRGKLE